MNIDNCYLLIPARKGSKGFPLKNRKLFEFTADIIPEDLKSKTFVSTDDEYIKNLAADKGVKILHRPDHLATDNTSMKDVVKDFIKSQNIPCDSNIILLYLTYPERTWEDVKEIYSTFLTIKEKSIVCCEEVKEHPYLCFLSKEDNRGELLVGHKLYRRQDYPTCLKLSMFVSCYSVEIIDKLHNLMFEEETYFYKLNNHKIDIDYLEQFLTISKMK